MMNYPWGPLQARLIWVSGLKQTAFQGPDTNQSPGLPTVPPKVPYCTLLYLELQLMHALHAAFLPDGKVLYIFRPG